MTWRWYDADGGDSRLPRAAGSGPRWGAADGGGRPAAAAHSARKKQKRLAENSEGGEPLHEEAGKRRADSCMQETRVENSTAGHLRLVGASRIDLHRRPPYWHGAAEIFWAVSHQPGVETRKAAQSPHLLT